MEADGRRALALVVHFHQPVGNLERVMRRATRLCYRPFLETISDHPDVPWTLHYSGCLLRWLEANEPDVPELLRTLVARGQVEMLTGGIEEPILASIPERDRIAQVERMSARLRRDFGVEAGGLWLTERVWEPVLARTMARTGIGYTVLDDTSLQAVGLAGVDLEAGWITDYEGESVRLFAASRRLRYLIPYGAPARVLAEVERCQPGGLLVYADDGEKFGEWPRTHQQVYGRRWLERFLVQLEEWTSAGRMDVIKLAEAAQAPPRGRVQVPSCSYDEMMTWALPTGARHTFEMANAALRRSDPLTLLPHLRGASWHAFLVKYPEVARLHQAMLRVSRKVEEAGSPAPAVEQLHLAQCNCAYWHGTFGGAYLSFLRLALWHHLIRAERSAERAMGHARAPAVELGDLDADGFDEVRISAPWGYAIVAPHLGGQVVELVSWEGEANLTAVMGRHLESYHLPAEAVHEVAPRLELAPLAAPAVGDGAELDFDRVEIGALRDSLDGRWLDHPYQFRVGADTVRLWWQDEAVVLRKEIRGGPTGLVVAYAIEAKDRGWKGSLGVEVRSCPLAPGRKADSVRASRTRAGWTVDQAGSRSSLLVAPQGGAVVEATRVLALGSTLKGVEAMYQGISLTMGWPVNLKPGGAWRVEIELRPRARAGSPTL